MSSPVIAVADLRAADSSMEFGFRDTPILRTVCLNRLRGTSPSQSWHADLEELSEPLYCFIKVWFGCNLVIQPLVFFDCVVTVFSWRHPQRRNFSIVSYLYQISLPFSLASKS
jgi:hypothetical protein